MNNRIDIYTDGSCNPHKEAGGWAAIILMNGEEIPLSGSVKTISHNAMELLAVIKAFEYIDEKKLHDYEISVYSDSQYVVNIIDRKEKLIKNNFLTKKGTEIYKRE